MKKRILALLTVMLLAVLMTTAVSATTSIIKATPQTGVDYDALTEAQTFDVYIVVGPTERILTSTNYIYRVDEDTNTGAPTVTKSLLTDNVFTVKWDKNSLEVSAVEYYSNAAETIYPSADKDIREAGDGYLYAYAARTVAVNNSGIIVNPTVAGVGTGESNTGVLTVTFADKSGGFIVRGQSAVLENVAVAKVTFKVVSGAEGGEETITLDNTYKYNGTSYSDTQTSVSVTVLAGCKHENKAALTPAELEAAGLENSEPTCIATGSTWYYCSDCEKNIEEVHNTIAHSYTVKKYLASDTPDCYESGKEAMHCATEGCTAYDESTVADVPVLGHDCVNQVYMAATCTEEGYDYYWCTRCKSIAAVYNSSNIMSGAYYIDGKLYSNPTGTTELTTLPEAVVLAALGHDWVKGRTVNGVTYYSCSRKDECGVADTEVSLSDTVRYVANAATGTGDGSSVENATTLSEAFKAFKDLPESVEATIYLVGTVELYQHQVSSNNTVAKSFEEYPHAAAVTVTTAPGESQATIHFPFATASQYLLYGPTTFDNVSFSSSVKGTTAGNSASLTIAARGFKVTMTENVKMLSQGSGIWQKDTTSKLDGNFALATPVDLTIPDCKMYLVGGFTTGGYYDGCSTTSCDSDMTILGGQFWVVAGSARHKVAVNNSTINVTIGGKAEIGQFLPISTTAGTETDNTVVNIHYIGGGTVACMYRSNSASTTHDYTVNHFFYNDADTFKVGDFMMGSTSHSKYVNCYYSVMDEGVIAFAEAFNEKSEMLGTSGVPHYITYKETREVMSFPEYCIEYLGGHDYVNRVCTFCETKICTSHTVEQVITKEATCMVDGSYYERCSKCYEVLSEAIAIEASSEYHDASWSVNTSSNTFEYICSVCQKVLATRANTTAEIYVSDNGVSDGGFTADYPVNDFVKAYELAVAFDGDATIYVVGTVTVPNNYAGDSTHTIFAEPEHDNIITVAGYNNSGVLKFPASEGGRMIYALNGDTTFENVEFSAWEYSANNGYSYIAAQHHHLTLGENISIDFMRNSNQVYNTCSLIIIGGCYRANYNIAGNVAAKNCAGGENHVTVKSGSYYEFIGGSVGGTCQEPNVTIEVLGDITFRDYFVLGGFEQGAGDVTMIVDGNLSTGNYFSLAGVNKTADLSAGAVGNVTLKIYSGSIFVQNGQSSANSTTYRPLGGLLRPENDVYDITRNLDSLTIFYDPAVASAEETALRFKSSPHSKTITYKTLDGDYCEITAGDHTPGTLVESVESICSAQGYEIYICSEVGCGKEFTVALDVVDHSFGETEMASAATCINPQIDKEVCGECGLIVYSVNDANGATGEHTYDANNICTGCSVSKEVYCEHTNVTTSDIVTGCGAGTETVCADCGKVTVNITSSAHNFGKYTVTVQPTATEPGVKTRTCKACGKSETAIIYADGSAADGSAIAVDANGNLADLEVATSKLTKAEKEVLNALLQDTAYGSEVKVSYKVEGDKVTGITYSIPLPAEYANMHNVKVVVKDDDGTLNVVEFTIEKGYIVFAY